ncbi:hypothetical protein [Saccharopolyspora phatthalungensis]|uniref:Uncharacterized protein n=1 Tax=Saccharopolyspora phatthalungensis TaxID=664693 RepID=A0A840Q858_9PSEU|nr:hypothetical protein [Saccharopolyspora phatthalungensis]MBB5158702.1 hypothetical protein [Saccharopolyspora phatthalungensis]
MREYVPAAEHCYGIKQEELEQFTAATELMVPSQTQPSPAYTLSQN